LANEYLDKVLPEKDANGMRLFNGEKLIVQAMREGGAKDDMTVLCARVCRAMD